MRKHSAGPQRKTLRTGAVNWAYRMATRALWTTCCSGPFMAPGLTPTRRRRVRDSMEENLGDDLCITRLARSCVKSCTFRECVQSQHRLHASSLDTAAPHRGSHPVTQYHIEGYCRHRPEFGFFQPVTFYRSGFSTVNGLHACPHALFRAVNGLHVSAHDRRQYRGLTS